MATITRRILSGSTYGAPIEVLATTSPGTTIHAGPTATSNIDEVYGWIYNTATAPRTVVVEFSGTASANHIWMTIRPQDGPYAIMPGLLLVGNGLATPVTTRAYATATGCLNISGYVNRIA